MAAAICCCLACSSSIWFRSEKFQNPSARIAASENPAAALGTNCHRLDAPRVGGPATLALEEGVLQLPHARRHACLDGTKRDADQRGDLPLRVAREVGERERLALR